jgi:hypothetical protein
VLPPSILSPPPAIEHTGQLQGKSPTGVAESHTDSRQRKHIFPVNGTRPRRQGILHAQFVKHGPIGRAEITGTAIGISKARHLGLQSPLQVQHTVRDLLPANLRCLPAEDDVIDRVGADFVSIRGQLCDLVPASSVYSCTLSPVPGPSPGPLHNRNAVLRSAAGEPGPHKKVVRS